MKIQILSNGKYAVRGLPELVKTGKTIFLNGRFWKIGRMVQENIHLANGICNIALINPEKQLTP